MMVHVSLSAPAIALGILAWSVSGFEQRQDRYLNQHVLSQAEPSSETTPVPFEEIPQIGFGTWRLDKSNASDAVLAAFEAGYRHIDCAAIYGNEKEVGDGIQRAMKKLNLKREDFWVTSKLWNDHHDPDTVASAISQTLTDLQVPYLDLYHMHWPVAQSPNGKQSIDFVETWTAMAKLLNSSTNVSKYSPTRHIGVANFDPEQLALIIPIHKPYLHQFETHPYLPQTTFIEAHQRNGIRVTAYSPLANANPTYDANPVKPLLKNKIVKKIAKKRGCTPAQVALAWGLHRGTSVIPKSQHAARIIENFKSQECELKSKDFKALSSKHLPTKRFNNPSKSWGVELFNGLQDSVLSSTVVSAATDMYDSFMEWFLD